MKHKILFTGPARFRKKEFFLLWGIAWEWVIIPVVIYFFPGQRNFSDIFSRGGTTFLTGLVLLCLGLLWTMFSAKHLCSRGKGTIIPRFPPEKLVCSGIYRLSRNPMYLGYFFLFWAGAFLLGRFALFLFGIGVILFIFTYIKFHEEKLLVKRFGPEYHTYRENVPIFFPKKCCIMSIVTWMAFLWVVILVLLNISKLFPVRG